MLNLKRLFWPNEDQMFGGRTGPTNLLDLEDVNADNISNGETLVWSSATGKFIPGAGGSGSGDVTGPSSSIDNAIVRFDGTTGKIIQDYTSGAPTISDTGDMTLAATKIYKIDTINMLFARGTISYYVGGAGNTSSSATSSLGMGSEALSAIETNGFNTGVGNFALKVVTSGAANTSVGYNSLSALITGDNNVALGTSAGRLATGSRNIFIGESAGRYETGNDAFYVNNRNQLNTASDKANSLLYGVMNATASSQTLVTNSAFTATYGMNIPTGQTYKINGVALAAADITGAITASSTDTLTNKTLTAPKFADLGFIADANGNEMLQFDLVTSAVNYVRMINSITTVGPTIIADGDDANIDLRIGGKNNGDVVVFTDLNMGSNRLMMTGGGQGIQDSGTNELLKFIQVASAVNEFTISNTITNVGPLLEVTGNDSNIDMRLKAKGTGATKLDREVQIVVFDFTTDVTTGDGKFYFHIDRCLNGLILSYVHAEVITAGTTGTTDIQIANIDGAVDVLSTKLTIDSGETGSDTAATPAVINTSNDDATTNHVWRIDVDAVSTTAPKGLIVTLGFKLP